MINHRLWKELDKVAFRVWRLRFWSALAAAWLLAALVGAFFWATGLPPGGNSRVIAPLLCGMAAVLAGVCVWLARASRPNYVVIARRIETAFPDLGSCLLAALEQQPSLQTGRFGYLQENVIGEALVHADRHAWRNIVSARRMALAIGSQFATLALFLLSLVAAAFWVTPAATVASVRDKRPGATDADELSFVVEPGDTEIERGSSLLILARYKGPVPLEAVLTSHSAAADATRTAMSPSLADPVFGGRIQTVQEPLEYHVTVDGRVSPTYHVTVFEYPRLERADARLAYPKYTNLEERLVQDFRTLSVVEGTVLTLICHLNKRVASAILTEKGAEPLALAAVDDEHADYHVTILCEKSQRLKLELVDDAGRANLTTSELSIQVVPNQPPIIKPVFPARDYEVSALEEMDVKATVFDDFSIPRFGVSYALAGKPEVDIVLGENAAGKQKHNLASKIDFEALGAQPDDLLSYFFWAEDYDRNGQVRRTSSDMYFAEVRRFDEIFRQGQQPAAGQQQQRQQQQGQGQNAQAAQQLAQRQKEIMNATWKLVRREMGEKPTKDFATDVSEVAKSQTEAREQALELGEQVRDSESQVHLTVVLDSMQKAAELLQSAHDEPSSKPLQPALGAEQAAYQALLKLRAREHEVVRRQRQQQASSSAASGARSEQQRQQLDLLDLSAEENRYETQRDARSKPEEAADRETRQVLNRLKELARRQHDLNERLKDLQSALQEAESQEKKEEIRRQLKRLEEEQTQVLRDTDELASRMDSPENQERMAQERQQLEQTRDQVRRTSEALENEMVTQAAASGTRAEREFDELRNEFRRRASGRFNDQMRDMRETARELDRKEKELAEKLSPSGSPQGNQSQDDRRAARREPAGGAARDLPPDSDNGTKADRGRKSLRDDNRSEQVVQGIAEQRQRLSNLVDRMKETIQEAEQTEPLLTERLYEAARNAQDQALDRKLEATRQSLQRGFVDDARQQEQAAGKGIEKLREGVERAAEAVLGDEAESLRRAREELQELSRELNQEIARNAPDGPQPRDPRGARSAQGARSGEAGEPDENQPGDTSAADQNANRNDRDSEGDGRQQDRTGDQPRNGRRGAGDRQAGQRQANDRQNGGRQRGRNQPGENQQGDRPNGEEQADGSDEPGDPQQQGQQPGGGQRSRGRQQAGQQRDGQRQNGQQRNGQQQNGQQPQGQQPGGQQRGGQQPGEGQPGAEEQEGRQPGEQQEGQNQPGGQQPGRGQNGQRQPGNQRGGGRQANDPQNARGGNTGGNPIGGRRLDGPATPGNPAAEDPRERVTAPIAGNDFLNWSDRLRDVEEMVDDPELRAEAARIRDRARSIRAELKRHSIAPNWDLVRMQVAEPLAELSDRVSEELLRRNSRQAIVPLDRDPVPPKYSEKTRRYYEQLGSGK